MWGEGPGTIRPATSGEDFFVGDAKPALAGGGQKPQAVCCGMKIEVTLAAPVFGQNDQIEVAVGAS